MLTIKPMDRFGAEVANLAPQMLTRAEREELALALGRHGLLVARDLRLSPDEQVALTRVFGEPDVHPIESIRLVGVPEIIELKIDLTERVSDSDADADDIVGDIAWHSDLTYTTEPSRGSLLYALEVPPVGGDTGFIDTVSVYEALPDELRSRIKGLKVAHSFGEMTERQVRAAGKDREMTAPSFGEAVHPIVHQHPVSGQPALNISPMFARSVLGWSASESAALLDQLTAFATQERFTYFHHWSVGDLLVWDNWRTMHIATGHPKRYRRHMLRTTIRGGTTLSPP